MVRSAEGASRTMGTDSQPILRDASLRDAPQDQAELVSAPRKRRDLETSRESVELLDQGLRQLDAVDAAVGAPLAPFAAGQPDGIEARQGRRRRQIVEMAIHLGGEYVRRDEARHVECNHE